MQANNKQVVFAHGKESGPWGHKIRTLAAIAEARGWAVVSPDYSGTHDPDARTRQLLDLRPEADRLVLCGSSMGGYVSAMACRTLTADGLFLMAPALYLPGYEGQPDTANADTVVVHGWRDAIVPPDSALRFAREHGAELHVTDDEHRLVNSLSLIGSVFDALLARLDQD